MRIAALLAILARSITQHVFQPTYILEDKDEKDEIRSLLVHLAITNSKKESFCRALLLSIFPDDQAVNGTKAVERVIREVPWCVRNLVSDAQYKSFRLGVEDIVRKARGAWQLVQGTREKFEPYFELNHYVDFGWQPLKFDNGGVGVGDESLGRAGDDEALLMIFPRIYIIADSEPDPVTPGVVLIKSQSTPAAKEIERNKPFSPTTRVGPRSVRQRSKAEQTLRDVENTEDGFMEELSVGYIKADRTTISLSWRWLMSIYSPPPASYQRISYICGCGELSYLDVRELSPGGIERFRQRLVNSASAVRNPAQDPPTSSHPALPAQVHLDNNMNTPHINTPQLRRPTLSRLENVQAVSTTF